MRLTNCNALIWNLKCRSYITLTALIVLRLLTTLQGGKLANPWCFQACSNPGCYNLVMSVWVYGCIYTYMYLSRLVIACPFKESSLKLLRLIGKMRNATTVCPLAGLLGLYLSSVYVHMCTASNSTQLLTTQLTHNTISTYITHL